MRVFGVARPQGLATDAHYLFLPDGLRSGYRGMFGFYRKPGAERSGAIPSLGFQEERVGRSSRLKTTHAGLPN